ncbi:hypothetical protein [Actinoplanes subglobosus]|uniref:Uncharacterized protein n=1 Tax=Actinoplanes subglobosus TaxID=1547892 RepID=A0ABV8J6R6_9ACTN
MTEPELNTQASTAPKLCRGCREQMPTHCDGCSRKTAAYCRTCLHSDTPGPRGTDRPRSGDLQQAVAAVMGANPLPDFGDITGWTSARIGAHLPGHAPAAILAAVRRLAATGSAEQVGDEPERYRPTR